MARIVGAGDVKAVFETDVEDSSINVLIDAAEDAIDRRFGLRSSTAQTDKAEGGGQYYFLSRPAASITSVTETTGSSDTVLSADDYELLHGGRQLRRLADGTNGASRWAERVAVVYTPKSDDPERKRVVIDLVKLSLRYDATKTKKDGDHSESAPDYEQEREKILSSLSPPLGVLV